MPASLRVCGYIANLPRSGMCGGVIDEVSLGMSQRWGVSLLFTMSFGTKHSDFGWGYYYVWRGYLKYFTACHMHLSSSCLLLSIARARSCRTNPLNNRQQPTAGTHRHDSHICMYVCADFNFTALPAHHDGGLLLGSGWQASGIDLPYPTIRATQFIQSPVVSRQSSNSSG
jgi:hypothetical protein